MNDMADLMALPAFRKFLWRLIQSAGILQPGTNGTAGRDLNYLEGRRSLGFDALRDAEQAFADDLRTPECILTISALLREAAQPQPKKVTHGRDYDD